MNRVTEDPVGAFVPGPRVMLGARRSGPLSGRVFAAKDLFDVRRYVATCGNPDWARTHPPADATAPAIEQLLDAGARLVGKTITDELAFSLEGENVHYGTPINSRAPGRLPGGSSSGSASAVAAGLVDFALGTDTGGSVRIPASYCGLFALRPTHGRVSLDGVMPLAPSYDTVGWFARDGITLAQVGAAILSDDRPEPIRRFLWVRDAEMLVDPGAARAVRDVAQQLFEPMDEVELFEGSPSRWSTTYRRIQGWEAWHGLGPWITATRPRFAPTIAERFAAAARVTEPEADDARRERATLAAIVGRYVDDGTVLVLPAAPSVAPLRGSLSGDAGARYRDRALALTSIAGHGGRPEVVLPVASEGGLPIGLGIIGRRGADAALLRLAADDRVQAAAKRAVGRPPPAPTAPRASGADDGAPEAA